MIETKVMERYFFFGLFFATLFFAFMIFRPFWVVLVLGASFSVVLYPVYEWLKKYIRSSAFSSFLTVVLFTIIVCGPILGIGAIILNQSQDVYHLVVDEGSAKPFLDQVDNAVNQFLPEDLVFNIHAKVSSFLSYISKNIANIFSATVTAFFSFALLLLVIFYFLKDGEKWRQAVIILSPLGDSDDEQIIKRLAQAVKGVIVGNLLIGLIQGFLMGVGLWIFGVPNAALWGIVAAVFSLLPTFGTAFVSAPAIIFLFVTGNTGAAVGLLIWAALAVGMIDNLLSPFIIGGKTNIPPLLILFAVLGGIAAVGPVGILVGPLTISLLYTLISIYRNEYKQSRTTAV